LDEQDFQKAIAIAVDMAQEESGTRLRSVTLVVPAPFSLLKIQNASMQTSPGSECIEEEHIGMLIKESLPADAPMGYVLMQSTPVAYWVDGLESAQAPVGQDVQKLQVQVSHLYVQESFLLLVKEALREINVEVDMCVSAGLVQASLMIPESKRTRPAVLVDMGYTHTDVSLIEQGAVTNMETLEVGGMHFAKTGKRGGGVEINSR